MEALDLLSALEEGLLDLVSASRTALSVPRGPAADVPHCDWAKICSSIALAEVVGSMLA